MFIDIFRRLRTAVTKTYPKKKGTNTWILFHNNAPAHQSVFCEDFLTKKNMTTLDHPPYSPDLAAADLTFYLRRLRWSSG